MIDVMSYDRFKKIMEIIINYDEKLKRVSDFMEKEIAEDSYCFVTLGRDIQSTLINMLADEFDCWYSTTGKPISHWWYNEMNYGADNDISWWLYSDKGYKKITVNGVEIDLETLPKFYDYLLESYMNKKLNGDETEFVDTGVTLNSDSLDLIKSIFNTSFDIKSK